MRIGQGYDVHALVAGTDGCADELLSTGWVGPDDGEPVGPLDLVVTNPVITAGIGSRRPEIRTNWPFRPTSLG